MRIRSGIGVVVAACALVGCGSPAATGRPTGGSDPDRALRTAVTATLDRGTEHLEMVSTVAGTGGPSTISQSGDLVFAGPRASMSAQASGPGHDSPALASIVIGRTIYTAATTHPDTPWSRGRLPQSYAVFGVVTAPGLLGATAVSGGRATTLAGRPAVTFTVHVPGGTVGYGHVTPAPRVLPYDLHVWTVDGVLARITAAQTVVSGASAYRGTTTSVVTISDLGAPVHIVAPTRLVGG